MSSISDSLGSLAKSAGIMVVGTVIGRFLGLVGETILIRQLEPSLFGKISLSYTIVITLGNILLLGMNEGVTRLASSTENMNNQWEIIQTGGLIAVFSGITGIFTVSVFIDEISKFMSEPSLVSFLPIFLPYLVLFPLSQVVIAALRVQGRTSAMVATRAIIGRILSIVGLGIALLAGFQIIAAVTLWMMIPFVVILLGGYLAIGGIEIDLTRRPKSKTFYRLWGFSWPLAIGSIVFLLLSQLDLLMIGYFLQASDIGNYRSIQPLQQAATLFMGSFSFIFLPLATEYYEAGETEELERLFTVTTKWAVLLTLPIVLVFTISADSIVQTLFGPEYQSAALPLSILSAGLFIRALVGPNGDVIKAIDKPKIELYAGSLGLVSNFFLNILLIPQYGIAGAAIATVGGYTVYNLIEIYAIYVAVNITPISSNIVKPVLVSGLVIFWYQSVFSYNRGIVDIISIGIASGIVTLIALVLTKSVEEEDILLLEKIETRLGKDLGLIRRFLQFGMK